MKLWTGVLVALVACGSDHDAPKAKPEVPTVVAPRDAVAIAVDADSSPCGPLRLVMDDDRSITPSSMLARTHNAGDLELVISTETLTCSAIATDSRALGPTEITVVVNLGLGTSPMSQDVVEFDGDRQDATLQLEGSKPHAAGDAVAVCVAPTTLRGLAKYTHHHVQIAGTARATYCP